jgi:arabinogalactan endo-1,4-beta-galactosidase
MRSVSVFASHRFVTAFSGFLVTTGTTDYTTLAWAADYNPRPDLEFGTVMNTYLLLREWNRFWKVADPLAIMFDNGIRWLRTPVLMTHSTYLENTPWELWPTLPWRDEYWSCFEYIERLLTEAAAHGFRLSVILNLSDKAAHAGVQDAPASWRGLSVEDTGARLEEYAYETAKYFADRGLVIEEYEIGSEIEWGILNFRPRERIAVPSGVDVTHNLDYMRRSVWSTEAQLLKRAIAGVKRATPAAAITLHVDSLDLNPEIAVHFFQTMVDLGVEFDHAGISLPYPDTSWSLEHYSSQCWFRRLLSVVNAIASLGKPVVICEGVYPSDTRGVGGAPMPDYPYSPAGQTAWVRDVLAFVSNTPAITGFYYWCADWFPGISSTASELKVQSYGLFANDREIKPAMAEFRVTLPPD